MGATMTKIQEKLQKHAAACLRLASDLTEEGARDAAALLIEAATATNRAFDIAPLPAKDAAHE